MRKCSLASELRMSCMQYISPEAEFIDAIRRKVSFKNFPPCYLQSPLLKDPPPPTLRSKSCLKLVCNVNIVYGNLKSENSQDYVQKLKRNCAFMNSASYQMLMFLFCDGYPCEDLCGDRESMVNLMLRWLSDAKHSLPVPLCRLRLDLVLSVP